MTDSPLLMDVNDVAKALRVSPHTVRRWAAEKRLTKIKLGSRALFHPTEIARMVEEAIAEAEMARSNEPLNQAGNKRPRRR